MSRLIDADAVLERIERDCDARCLYKDYKEPLRSKMCNCCDLGDARMYVEDAPTVDAERHGHWVKENEEDTLFCFSVYKCSLCGGEVLSEAYLFKYCPYCGCAIKMEVEEDEID